jgi:hypothetical protein
MLVSEGEAVTEQLWIESKHPALLIDYIQKSLQSARTKKGRRQLRLFACGCCRLIWPYVTNTQAKHVVEVAERFADGNAAKPDLEKAQRALLPATIGGYMPNDPGAQARTAACMALNALSVKAMIAGDGMLMLPLPLAGYCGSANEANTLIANLLRDVFGDPFRPATFFPSWRTDTAVTLARQMYDSREFGAMPILADALQDAGCDSDDVLSHCRDTNATHVRGCWVTDLVLGKE